MIQKIFFRRSHLGNCAVQSESVCETIMTKLIICCVSNRYHHQMIVSTI